MITEHCLKVINLAKDQKTKAGKFKMRDENRTLIEKFLSFDVTKDWMESKDYTKLGRALASAVFTGSELIDQPLRGEEIGKMGVHLYDNIIFLRLDKQWHLRERLAHLPTDADAEREELRSTIATRVEALVSIVDAFESMKNRLTKNGKFPKEEAERLKRAAIKGSLDKKLSAVLTDIKNEWIKIIYEHELDWMKETAARVAEKYLPIWNGPNGVDKDSQQYCATLVIKGVLDHNPKGNQKYTVAPETDMQKRADRIANDEGDGWFFKMADKLGGLVTGKRQFIDATHSADSNTPYSSYMHFKFENNTSFSIENKIVTNRSPLNNYFYQYPCIFFNVIIDGAKMKGVSELTVKQAFLK